MFNSQVVPYASLTGPYAYVAAGAGLRDQGYGLIDLTWPGGSTANLVAAYLVWSILNNSVPPSNGTLNGGNVDGTWTAYATPSPCWTVTYIYTFVADVTPLVVNGINNLTNFPSGVTNGQDPWSSSVIGPVDDTASLVAIYDNASSTALHQVTVYSGASPIGSPAPNTETAELNYSTTNSSAARTTFLVADGQLPHNYASWNGTQLSNDSFPGNDPHESPAVWSYGNLSDTKTYDVPVAVGSNSTTALVGSLPSSDCLTWVGQVLSVGVAAARGPYPVVFQEQGLPNGTSWNLTTHGSTGSGTVAHATSSIRFSLGNGSYTYTVGAVPGYPAPSSVSYQVQGGPVFIRVIFHQLLYFVTFNETGLPYLAFWWVDFTNASQGVSQNLSAYAPAPISLTGGNGTFSFSSGETGLYQARPAHGSVSVNGADLRVTISFVPPPLYSVTVRAVGLPIHTSWGATTYSNWGSFYNLTSNRSFVVELPNTTVASDYLYPYAVAGYSSVGYLLFGVSGTALTLDVNYTKLYNAQLFETGLPRGTYWQAYLYAPSTGNLYGYSGSPYLNFSVGNGSYAFSVDALWGFSAAPSTGNLTVAGANVSQTIVFTAAPKYTLSFNETGLLPGANWTVSLGLPNGSYIARSSTTSTVTFLEPNGTYTFFPAAIGYTVYPYSGYVAISGGNNSYPIAFTRLYSITFTESGLPSGSYWQVYINYEYLGTYSTSFVAWVSNGTYSWTAISSGTYAPSPTNGTLTIAGSNTAQSIRYTSSAGPTYPVEFTESGLAAQTNWSVDLNYYTEWTTGTSLNFTESNGTFGFTVLGVVGYTPTPGSGSVDVSGGAPAVPIAFAASGSSFSVTFTESGLPNGATSYVNVTGEPGLSTTVAGVDGTTVEITLPNATYTYAASSSTTGWTTPASSGFTVAGVPLSEPVPFTSTSVGQYLVSFTESGLPDGATWYVNISGQPALSASVSASAGTTVSIELPNATYSYATATSTAGWTTPASGGFTVAGAALDEPVPFTSTSVAEYAVTFTESGLPSGATWYVNITGQPPLSATVAGSGGTTVSIDLPNAGYTFAAATNEPRWTNAASGAFTVAGAALSEPVPFASSSSAPTYLVTFTEAGLPVGATWYVNISGEPGLSATVSGSSGTQLTISLSNGSYAFAAATSSKGWTTTSGATLSVAGAAQSVTVGFKTLGGATSPASTSSSVPWLWIGIGLLILIALLLLILVAWRRRKKDQKPPAPPVSGPETPPPGTGP